MPFIRSSIPFMPFVPSAMPFIPCGMPAVPVVMPDKGIHTITNDLNSVSAHDRAKIHDLLLAPGSSVRNFERPNTPILDSSLVNLR